MVRGVTAARDMGYIGFLGSITGDADDLGETCLVDREMVRVPCCDPFLVQINYVDSDRRVVIGNESGGWSTWNVVSAYLVDVVEGLYLPTKPAPTKQMFLTEGAGADGKAVMVSDRECRCSVLRSGDSPRELGGEVSGVASPDPQESTKADDIVVIKESVLMSRTKGGICTDVA